MLRLDIDIQHAKLGLEIEQPKTNVTIPKPSARVETEPPAFYVDIDLPRMYINARKAFGDIGLKDLLSLAREQAQRAREKGWKAIGGISADGDQMAAIEHGARVAQVTAAGAWPEEDRVLNVDARPKHSPEMIVVGGVEFSATWGYVETNWRNEWIDLDLRWGAVRTYLRQKAHIEIRAVGNRLSLVA